MEITIQSVNVRVTGELRARLQRAHVDAARRVLSQLNSRMQDSLNQRAWSWPRDLPTRRLQGATVREKLASYLRGDGVTAGNPRNIVDIGSLRQSYMFEYMGLSATYKWTANYASYVHDGANIYPWGNRRRRVYLPPRPWTDAVLGNIRVAGIQPYNLQDEFIAAVLLELRR